MQRPPSRGSKTTSVRSSLRRIRLRLTREPPTRVGRYSRLRVPNVIPRPAAGTARSYLSRRSVPTAIVSMSGQRRMRLRSMTCGLDRRRTFQRSAKRMGMWRYPSTACGCGRPYLHNGSVPSLADLLDAAGREASSVLARIRRLRSREGRIRVGRIRRPGGSGLHTTHRSRATAMPVTSSVHSWMRARNVFFSSS